MSLFDVTVGMLRQRCEFEDSMARKFCSMFKVCPEGCTLELREMPDGCAEYWMSYTGGQPMFVGRALPLEFERDGDSFNVKQKFEMVKWE